MAKMTKMRVGIPVMMAMVESGLLLQEKQAFREGSGVLDVINHSVM